MRTPVSVRTRGGPSLVIHSQAPLRINDIGGWTDTWFARRGAVLNMAVGPPVEVQVRVFPNPGRERDRVLIRADNYGRSFRMNPDRPSTRLHPLLQFCLAAVPPPPRFRIEVRIHSPVPGGISTGTSASVCVALLGALAGLTGRRLSAQPAARLAHRVETERLGLQSGIQDQMCAARGGICHIRMSRYPEARARNLRLRPEILSGLGRRLVLVYLGKPHCSSDLHQRVISLLREGSPRFEILKRLAELADAACRELERGDLESYGRLMIENNECQRALYDKLISAAADEVIRLARRHRSSGWKVNGAGGRGGSLTLLASPDDGLRRSLLRDIEGLGGGIRSLPFYLSPSGLEVWKAG